MAAVKVNKEQHIETVKNFPCLYDTSRKEYKDDLLHENAWSGMCAELFGSKIAFHSTSTLWKYV